jgi:thiamine-phosphate pyrophosphorylase
VLLYYITDRKQFAGDETAQRRALLGKIGEAVRCGVDFIQLREKDISVRELEDLAHESVRVVREAGSLTRLLINSRTDVAIASGADGVHLRSNDISSTVVRAILPDAMVGVSCHSLQDVQRAESEHATFAVFAPVFEKKGLPSAGLETLTQVCREKIPVLALGGVTVENAVSCLYAGASGIAGIRLFQDHDICETVSQLRKIP